MHIKNVQARYHRNGVAGIGFFNCQFVWRDGRTKRDMRAIVFPGNDDSEDPPTHYAITSGVLNERWRGDNFIRAIWKAILDLDDKVYRD